MSTLDPERAHSVADSERGDRFALKRVDYNYVTLVDLQDNKARKVKAFDVKSSLSTLSLPRSRAKVKQKRIKDNMNIMQSQDDMVV